MKQEIPYTMVGISAAAVRAEKALEGNQESIVTKYCTAAVMNAARLLAFVAMMAVNNGKFLLSTRRDARDKAMSDARAFATLLRDILKAIFGAEFNPQWEVVGFDGSLAIPKTIEELLALMQSIVAFLTANPAREIAALNLTAAQAQIVYDALKDAFTAVTSQETAVKILMTDRDAKFAALREKLTQLVHELSFMLDPLDPRWKAFGFNMPGADETPDVPEQVQAVLISPNAAAIKWGNTPRAAYYHVWKKVIGVDTEPVAIGSPADLDFTMEQLPLNATIEVSVSAVNNGGESPKSAVVTIVTH